eukprot:397017-Pleurochrysis_carterae.AAC.3
MHAAHAYLPPAPPGRTFYTRGIPADVSSTAADVEAREFISKRALTRRRAQQCQHRLGDPVVDLRLCSLCRRCDLELNPRWRRRRSRHRRRNTVNATCSRTP